MKKNVASFFCVAIIVAVVFASIFATQSFATLNDVQQDNIQTIFCVGTKSDCVRYVTNDLLSEDGKFSGPQDFAVTNDGCIYLLDTQAKRIICSLSNKSTVKEAIELPSSQHPSRIWCFNNYIYVLDTVLDKIFTVCLDDFSLETVYLPSSLRAMFIEELYADEHGNIVIVEENNGITNNYYLINNTIVRSRKTDYYVSIVDDNATINLGSRRWIIEGIKNSFVQIAGFDSSNNLYLVVREHLPESSVIISELSIRKYDQKGKQLGCYLVNQDNWTAFPWRCAKATADGRIILMECKPAIVECNEITLVNQYVSKLQQHQIDSEIVRGTLPNKNSVKSSISLTRAQVKSRANSMINMSWTLQRSNRVAPTNATIPPYILSYSVPASGLQVTGIPYCWGGMNGHVNSGSSAYMKRFSSMITTSYGSNLYCAGNINSSQNYVPGTAGLDCSGFVGCAYGFSQKQNAAWFLNSYGTTIPFSSLEQMDMLVKSNHIMLFYSVSSSGSYTVYDATTTSSSGTRIDKASMRTESASYINGFTAKTPWN